MLSRQICNSKPPTVGSCKPLAVIIMRHLLTIIFGLLIGNSVFATGQVPDYLIYQGDTVAIFSNPLEQYFRLNNNRDIPDFKSECFSTGCWRGYIAYWTLKNDSLFLIKITPPVKNCQGNKDGNILKMFGNEIAFANWYNGTLIIPRGECFSGSDMGYSAIYAYEELLLIENGRKTKSGIRDNSQLIENIKQNNKFNEKIEGLKDTLLFYLDNSMNWEKLDKSKTKWCDDSYILFYDSTGRLKDLKLNTEYDDSISIKDKLFYSRMDKSCSSKMKKSLKYFSLAYLAPPNSFMLRIDLWYDKKLEIEECRRFYNISSKEIEDWIKKQMNTE